MEVDRSEVEITEDSIAPQVPKTISLNKDGKAPGPGEVQGEILQFLENRRMYL